MRNLPENKKKVIKIFYIHRSILIKAVIKKFYSVKLLLILSES